MGTVNLELLSAFQDSNTHFQTFQTLTFMP